MNAPQRSGKSAPANIAFALGGLAGNNAHGAGFLQAALDSGVTPRMISCTSGQIRWTALYLRALRSGQTSAGQLRQHLEEEIADLRPTGEINTDLGLLAVFGRPGYFRPAYDKLWADWLQNLANLGKEAMTRPGQWLLAKQTLSQLPARTLVPEFSNDYLARLAKTFNQETEIGIAFNAYNPQRGVEHVYLNKKARELLETKSSAGEYADGATCRHRPYRHFHDITVESLRKALWLYQYGFPEEANSGFLDGAYFRDIMLAELIATEKIYVVRPINREWKGAMPSNYPAMEDLKTEVNFNGCYAAERDQIELVNKLVAKHGLAKKLEPNYHHIDLIPVEVQTQRGYFDYIFESTEVFDAAYELAKSKF